MFMLEKMRPSIASLLGVDEEAITEETNFKEDLGADSLDLMELVMGFEDMFGVEIPTEDLTEISTVGDVIEFLKTMGIEA